MLEYYNNYLSNIAQTPNEAWRESQQAVINQLFEDTTLETTIEEEIMPFNFTFRKIDAWVDTVTEATLNAEKDDSDYRAIYFKDCGHLSSRGRYYRFYDNYWIVYSDPCIEEVMATQKVRRCNNWLKWVDSKGVLHEYPCVVDYSLSSTNAQTARLIQQANSHVTVIVQGNSDTLSISKNQRFIFNGVAFRFFAINNYMQNNYVDKDTPILFFDFYEDMIIDTDNLTDNIADDTRNDFTLVSNITQINNVNGYNGTLDIKLYNGDTEISDPNLVYTSYDTDVITIDSNGNYTIVGNEGDTATIYVQIKNNSLVSLNIPVTVTSDESEVYELASSGIVPRLIQGDTISIVVNTYKNGEIVEDTITCVPSWSDNSYYTLYQTAENTWELTNLRPNSNTLNLTFNSSNYGVELTESIKLVAMW